MNLQVLQTHMPGASSRKLPLALVERAERHRQRGELDRALEACERIVSECPGYVSGHIALARVRLDMSDIPGAHEALQAATSLDPMNPVAQNLLARLDLAMGLRERAQRRLRDILFFYPNDVEAVALLAEACRPEAEGQQQAPAEHIPPVAQPAPSAAEAAQAELENLRTTPGVTGAVVVDRQGLPLWGSLGRGEHVDRTTAAKVSAAVRVWKDVWAHAGQPLRAIVESEECRLVIMPCGESVLVVALSPRIRPGRVLGAIEKAAARLTAASVASEHETGPFRIE